MEGSPERPCISQRAGKTLSATLVLAMAVLAGHNANAEDPTTDQTLRCKQKALIVATETCPPNVPDLYRDCLVEKIKEVFASCMAGKPE